MHQRYPDFSNQLQIGLFKTFKDTTPDTFSASSYSGEKGKDSAKDSSGILIGLSSINLTDKSLNSSFQQLANSLQPGTSTLPLTYLSNAVASKLTQGDNKQQQLVIDVAMAALKQIGSPSTNAGLEFYYYYYYLVLVLV